MANEHVQRTAGDLFAVLVGDDGALGGTGICTEDDTVFEEASDDGCTRARGLG